MEFRKLTEYEFLYCWYIEYGHPYHYIPVPPVAPTNMIGATIKTLISDGICIQLPNPTLENSPMYTRFTRQGRLLFLAHERVLSFRHPTEFDKGITYDELMNGCGVAEVFRDTVHRLGIH